jgi:hypothetical protein
VVWRVCSQGKGGSARRRIFGIVADNAVNAAFLLLYGEAGAYVFGIYLFVTFSNGFRYGRQYLRISQVLSIAGFLIVLFSPSGQMHSGRNWDPNAVGSALYVVVRERISKTGARTSQSSQGKVSGKCEP